jgi:hypothetical protein
MTVAVSSACLPSASPRKPISLYKLGMGTTSSTKHPCPGRPLLLDCHGGPGPFWALVVVLLVPTIAEAKAPWWYLDGFGEAGYTMYPYSSEYADELLQVGLGSTIALRIGNIFHLGTGVRYTRHAPVGEGYCHSLEFPLVARFGIPLSSSGNELRLGIGYGPVQRWERPANSNAGQSGIHDSFETSIAYASAPERYHVSFLMELGTRLGAHESGEYGPRNYAFIRLGVSYR